MNGVGFEPELVWLGRAPYEQVWARMRDYTDQRDDASPDQLWIVEHPPVFTQGTAGKPEHLISTGDIPVVQSDRGGQVTYHGPGQIVVYFLIDIKRRKLGVRALVTIIETSVIDLLAGFGIESYARADAPGVYVAEAKIAALGLRVCRGRSYHGLSLNVCPELEPFSRINPCGYAGMPVTSLSMLGFEKEFDSVAQTLCDIIKNKLNS